METTLIILKPDAVQRGLMGRIVARFEAKGLQIVAAKFIQVSEELARTHYAEHAQKPFFGALIGYITACPVLVLALRGRDAVVVCRKMIGATDGATAEPGSIRGDFGISKTCNLVHGSDSAASAERELALWFDGTELSDYQRDVDRWID